MISVSISLYLQSEIISKIGNIVLNVFACCFNTLSSSLSIGPVGPPDFLLLLPSVPSLSSLELLTLSCVLFEPFNISCAA